MPHLTHLPGEVRRRVLIHRRPLAAVLAGLAVLAALRATQPPAPATAQVWTASRDLPAGRVLVHDDLRRTSYAPGSVPAGVVDDPSAVVGRTLAAPLRRGAPLTDLSVVSRPLTSAYPGRVATPVRLADGGVVDLLRVGDQVDHVAADPQGRAAARTVAFRVTVIAIPRARPSVDDVGMQGRLVLMAVPGAEAADVAAAGLAGYLTVTLTG